MTLEVITTFTTKRIFVLESQEEREYPKTQKDEDIWSTCQLALPSGLLDQTALPLDLNRQNLPRPQPPNLPV